MEWDRPAALCTHRHNRRLAGLQEALSLCAEVQAANRGKWWSNMSPLHPRELSQPALRPQALMDFDDVTLELQTREHVPVAL